MKDLSHCNNLFFIGDLHGQWDAYLFGYNNLGITNKDYVISVGDVIDRGDKSIECLTYFLFSENATAVRGNHEEMMIRSELYHSRQDHACWINNGGEWSLDLPESYAKGLAYQMQSRLPYYQTILHKGTSFGVCHAESPTEDWGDLINSNSNQQLLQKAIWGYNKIKREEDLVIKNVDYTIHGHIYDKSVRCKGNQYWIDTGTHLIDCNEELGLTFLQWDGKCFTEHKVIKTINGFELI